MDSESIANFCAITDATDTTAEYFLSAAGGDLDMAIGLFYESNAAENKDRNIHEISATIGQRNEEISKAPIPVSSSSDSSEVVQISRLDSSASSQSESEDIIFNSTRSTAGNSVASRRLADLFRPPHGIMYAGSFEMARRHARELNRWLLVTIHAPTDFASQAMNRDIWNSDLLQSFIKENFVFVQMIIGGADASRYENFYPYDGLYPHVALIDPRTGERVETLLVSSIAVPGFRLVSSDRDMLEILGEFIAEHSMDPPVLKRSSPKPEEFEAEESEVSSNENEPSTKKCQLSPVIPEMVEDYTGPGGIQVQFRLPNGQKHRHRFDPSHHCLSQVFQTAAAVAQCPPGSFKLRTAEEELTEDDSSFSISKLHNDTLTIIK